MRSQDVVVAVSVHFLGEGKWTYGSLAKLTGLSKSETYDSIDRLQKANLIDGEKRLISSEFAVFLKHGLRFVFPAEESLEEATGWQLCIEDEIYVWPIEGETSRGRGLVPLHKSVFTAASKDTELHRLLSYVEILRLGQAMRRARAEARLTELLVGRTNLRPSPGDVVEDEPDTKKAILVAATRLFTQRGFKSTNLRDIAHCAGVNPSLISYHFGSKAGLQTKVLERVLEISGKYLGPVLVHGLNAKGEHFKESFNLFLMHLHEDEEFHRLTLWCRAEKDLGFDDYTKKPFTAMVQQLGAAIQVSAKKDGEIDGLCRAMAFLLLAEQYSSLRWNYVPRLNIAPQETDALLSAFRQLLTEVFLPQIFA